MRGCSRRSARRERAAAARPRRGGAVDRAGARGCAGDSERLHGRTRETLADLLREADHLAPRRAGRTSSAADVQARARRAGRAAPAACASGSSEEILRGTLLVDTEARRSARSTASRSCTSAASPSAARAASPRARASGSGERRRHRARGEARRPAALEGRADPVGLPRRALRAASARSRSPPAWSSSSPTGRRRRQRVRAPSSCALLSALAELPMRAVARHHRLGQPARAGAADRRRQREDRGLLRRLRGARPHRRAGRAHPRGQREAPDAARATSSRRSATGRFHVWAVETVDEAVELLTGAPAGVRGEDGRFPEGSVNRRADDRLAAFAERARSFSKAVSAAGTPPQAGEGDQ